MNGHTQYEFPSLLNEAWRATMITQTISAGFRRSGIHSLNQGAIVSSDNQSNETSGLPSSQNTTDEHLNDCEPEIEETIHFTHEHNQDQSLSEVYEFLPEQDMKKTTISLMRFICSG